MGYLIILIICIVVFFGYQRSLKTHPFTKCKKCDGKGRFYHKTYNEAFGLCPKCGGNGREKRFGARFTEKK